MSRWLSVLKTIHCLYHSTSHQTLKNIHITVIHNWQKLSESKSTHSYQVLTRNHVITVHCRRGTYVSEMVQRERRCYCRPLRPYSKWHTCNYGLLNRGNSSDLEWLSRSFTYCKPFHTAFIIIQLCIMRNSWTDTECHAVLTIRLRTLAARKRKVKCFLCLCVGPSHFWMLN